MAAVAGYKGSFSFAGATDLTVTSGANHLLATRWTGSIDREMHDATAFSPTGNARASIGGLHKMTGTAEGFLDGATGHDISHTTDEVPAAIVLTAYTGRTYSFDGWLSNFSVDTDVNGVVRWSAAFESSGVITPA